jgi:hypothetical protein
MEQRFLVCLLCDIFSLGKMHWLAFMAKDKNLQLKKYVKESLHLPQTANSRVFQSLQKPALLSINYKRLLCCKNKVTKVLMKISLFAF